MTGACGDRWASFAKAFREGTILEVAHLDVRAFGGMLELVGSMKHVKSDFILDRLISPLRDCLTPESAQRVLALKADPELQARVGDLATRHSEGKLTPEEQAEYGGYVSFST